nr:8688_t:CDS:2 [Entrophospora candida]
MSTYENLSEVEEILSEVEAFEEIHDSDIFQSFVEENEEFEDDYDEEIDGGYNEEIECDKEFNDFEEDNEISIGDDSNDDYFPQCSLMIFDSEKGCSMPCTQNSYRRLQQCIGVWEINKVSVKDADKELGKLGVCKYHFNLDQTPSYHPSGSKQEKLVNQAKMLSKRCLFCHKIFNIYSRGNYCNKHSWQISDRKLLISCICQFTCPSTINEILNKKSNNIANALPRYICQDCCYKKGCHIYNPPDVANSGNFEEKQKLLSNILPSLVAHWNNNETPQKPCQETPSHLPSPFLINTILQVKGADKLHENQKGNLNPDQSFNYGESLGNFILKSRKHINEHQQQLAKPNSLIEYYQAIPKVITMFFDGFIGVILKHHHELRKYKRKYYNLKTKIDDTEQDPMQLIKITTFLSSILILHSLHVISHTEDHERRLEIKRMEKVDPKSRIISGPNIWPLVVIDNLDTKQKTFKHNNYCNDGRTSFHVVLRMCFFFTLPSPIHEIVDSKKKNSGKYKANSLKEPLWKLTTDLLDLFENFDPNMTHHLIEKAPELTTDGFNSLFNSYDIGKRRIETLLDQEVYGTEEINTIGHRSTNVKIYKYEKLVEIYSRKKGKEKATNLEEIEEIEDPSNNNPIDISVPIEEGESSNNNKRRKTTEYEHSILDPLVEMDTKPTKDQINKAVEKTQWEKKRVQDFVNKRRKKKETQQQ